MTTIEKGKKAWVYLEGHGLICEIKAFKDTVHIRIPKELWRVDAFNRVGRVTVSIKKKRKK